MSLALPGTKPIKFYRRGGCITQKYGSRISADGWGSAAKGSMWDAVQAETPLYLRRLGGKQVSALFNLHHVKTFIDLLIV